MQIVILAAGSSSRFYPFNITHKASLKLLGKTIIEHTLQSVKKAGFTDVILVVNESKEISHIVGDGSAYGLHVTYVVQKTASGAGDALLLAKEYIQKDFFVIWGSRIEFHEFVKDMLAAKKETNGVVLVKETENIEGVGVAKLEQEKLVDIIEKPDTKNPPSKHKIVGVYLLPQAFLDTLSSLPSEHYSFEKALVAFSQKNAVLAVETKKDTLSLKYPWDILSVKQYLLKNMSSYTGESAEVAQHVVLQGNVYIDDGAKIMENVVIKGPAYIGKGAYIGNNALLRGGTVIEQDVVVGTNMEIKNSVLLTKSTTHSGFIGDSVIGENCKIAAEFCTANVRLDRQPVTVTVGEKEINSHQKSLGVLLGNNARVGIRVSTMPGTIIGRNVTIGPQTTVMHNISDDTIYYTKFSEIVEKSPTKDDKK
jgi:UDP-N-acetylglucosamine diphosphorylase/glucosamine-1-phosphate N-acetyltransferase